MFERMVKMKIPPIAKHIKLYIGLFILIIILGGAAFYKYYWVNTPQYALNMIEKAVQDHDSSVFDRYVNIDSVLDKGYDDYFSAYMDADTMIMNSPLKGLAQGIIKMAKPLAVNNLKSEINTYIKTGKWQNEEQTKTSSPEQPLIQNASINEKIGLKNIKFKNVEYVKENGASANIGLKIAMPNAKKEMTIDLLMKKSEAGNWQIVQITNVKDYVNKVIK